jgi:hypothetical protein
LLAFFGLSSLGSAGVLSIFFTASSNVVGGRMIGLPVRPAGLGRFLEALRLAAMLATLISPILY